MTDNLPVPVDPELERWRTIGYWLSLAESGSNDQKAQGAAAALRTYYADALGFPPLAAGEISVIKGRVYVGAKLLRALAAKRGYRVLKLDSSTEACTAAVVALNTGEELGRTTYTIADAKAAGLIRDGSAWKTHPARMLWARASKFALDDYAPEVTLGIYTAEDEAEEIEGVAVEVPDDQIPWDPAYKPAQDDGIEFGEPAPAPAGAAEGEPQKAATT